MRVEIHEHMTLPEKISVRFFSMKSLILAQDER